MQHSISLPLGQVALTKLVRGPTKHKPDVMVCPLQNVVVPTLVKCALNSELIASVVVSLQELDHAGLSHAISSKQLMLRCFCYSNSEKH